MRIRQVLLLGAGVAFNGAGKAATPGSPMSRGVSIPVKPSKLQPHAAQHAVVLPALHDLALIVQEGHHALRQNGLDAGGDIAPIVDAKSTRQLRNTPRRRGNYHLSSIVITMHPLQPQQRLNDSKGRAIIVCKLSAQGTGP